MAAHGSLVDISDFTIAADFTSTREGAGIPAEIEVEYDPAQFARTKHSDETEEGIEEHWKNVKRTASRLYNASKFRFYGVRNVAKDKLILQLGLTDARAALGTNDHPEKGAKLLAAGQSAGDKYKFLACPLSVAVVVETQDGSVAVLQRSRQARDFPNKWDAVSGDPEPSSVGIALSRVRVAGIPPTANRRGAAASPADLAEPICTAVFDMAVSRVVELLNLPSDQLGEPQLLGVVREERRYGSASVCVLVKYSGSASDLERRFNSAHRNRNSPSALAIIPALQLLSTNTTEPSVAVRGCRVLRPEPGAFVQDSDDSDAGADEEGKSGKDASIATEEDAVVNSDEMTPAGKGAFELWRFHRQKQAASRRIASLAL